MRPLWLVVAFLGCGGGSTQPQKPESGDIATGAFAEEDRFVPTYGKGELERAIEKERGAEATAERAIADLEAAAANRTNDDGSDLRNANADLAVRRRFIATLETCQASGRQCPPRLDDPPWSYDPDGTRAPPVTGDLRFDLESWRKLAAELFGRACACRTVTCVDTVGIGIDVLETRPMPQVQGDEVASESITRARQCLFRLRGRQTAYRQPRVEEP